MDPNAATELIQAVGASAAVVRLISLNLATRYRALVAYLILLAVIDFRLGSLSQVSASYFWSYIVLEPFACVFSIVAVRELLALTFNDYPGIRTAGRWVLYAGVALAVGISLLTTGFFWNGGASGRAHSHLFYFEVSKRSIVFTLAFVIVTILLFLSKYPLHLSRNTLVSSAFFSALFLSEALRLLIDSLAPELNLHYVDWLESAFVSICLVGWAVMLKPQSDRPPARIKYSNPGEDNLLHQLDSLNQLMTRAARR